MLAEESVPAYVRTAGLDYDETLEWKIAHNFFTILA